MSNVTFFEIMGPRKDQIEALQQTMSLCIRQTALELGETAVKAFFDGYKNNVEEMKKAA